MMNIYQNSNIFEDLSKTLKLSKFFRQKVEKVFGIRLIDILLNYPKSILNRNLLNEKIKIDNIGKLHSLDIKVISHVQAFSRKSPYCVNVNNNFNQTIRLVYFNLSTNYIKNILKIGEIYRITGTIEFFNNKFQIIHPNQIIPQKNLNSYEEYEPIYNLRKTNINKIHYRKLIVSAIEIIENIEIKDSWILENYRDKYKFYSFVNSLVSIHKPKNDKINDLEIFRKRLAFDEILSNIIQILLLRRSKVHKNIFKPNNFELSKSIINNLEFDLTKDQTKTMTQIKKDIKSNSPMFRLLQGDVGSGKTIVAILSLADLINSGYQACIMVPTEILARQHFQTLNKIFKNFNFRIEILTGKISISQKNKIYKDLKSNKINIVIGTHSLFNERLTFNNLSIIIIDEQHKFGVNQRLKLQKKAIGCHILIMSATPIPRSLTFAIFGDMDVSILKDKPKGRKTVITSIISEKKIPKLIEGIQRVIKKKEKVFWVMPEIGKEDEEQSKEKEKNESIVSRFKVLQSFFGNQILYIHGKMPKNEIEDKMSKFKNGSTMILLSTTVIEVGVDIPDASTIVIEYANKFGLAQLHQLRGRVGRGSLTSNCILIYHKKLSEIGRERLKVLKESNDGFYIAEQDLKLRGGGEIFGTKQTGLPSWNFFDPYQDIEMIDDAKENSKELLKKYNEKYKIIRYLISIFFDDKKIKNYLTG